MKISANDNRRTLGRKVTADEEVFEEEIETPVEDIEVKEEVADVEVEPEAMGLLFEAEDVAELIAEVTGTPVEVASEDEAVVFTVGDDEFTVTPEGDEEILEATRRPFRGKRPVGASRNVRRPVRSARDARRPARKPLERRPVRSTKDVRAEDCKAACGTKKEEKKPEKKEVKASRTIKKFPKTSK